MADDFTMNPNPLVAYLQKPAHELTRSDLIRFCIDQGIQMLNFRYAGSDGRLKTLNFVIQGREHLNSILSTGERVDGSSLFSHIEAGSSDLYVVPRYKTAFLNPFSEVPSLDILCSFYDKDGNPLLSSPEYILRRAHEVLKAETGFSFEAMGELEYYIISDSDPLFKSTDQKGYHESYPFNKWQDFREEAMRAIAMTGASIKYGHSEVGNFTLGDLDYEQNEIEFNPVSVEDAADQLLVAKWILRSLAHRYGVTVTFAPKISAGKAGSGLHIHTRLMKGNKNALVSNGLLNDTARRMIAGYMHMAPSLTAFGNTNPTSYFRLVPHQEAPTNICWGDRNRSVLVRVPLGWCAGGDMAAHANPQQEMDDEDYSCKQTVEFRCPDGSADIYLLLAGLTIAARHGLQMDNALEIAQRTYVDVNIFGKENEERVKSLDQLPVSCVESSMKLIEQAELYAAFNVFPEGTLANLAKSLASFGDEDLREKISGDEEKILTLVNKFIHCA